jgi:integrase
MLTDNKIKNLKPTDRPYPKADANGLTLYTLPTGSKSWRMRYRFHGKADTITFGKYPSISLKEARSLKELYLSVLSKGIDPKAYQKQQKTNQQNKSTFKEAFDTWINNHQGQEDGWTERTTNKLVSAFEKHVFPYIGNAYVEDIKTPDVYEVLKRIDDKGNPEVLKKVKRLSSRVFKDCVVKGIIEYNPVTNITNDNFRKQVVKQYATVTSEKDIKKLLLQLETYKQRGTYQIATALNLAPYLMLRPSEFCGLTWNNVEFDDRLIRIFSDNMKMRREHVVPMSNHVLSIFKEVKV